MVRVYEASVRVLMLPARRERKLTKARKGLPDSVHNFRGFVIEFREDDDRSQKVTVKWGKKVSFFAESVEEAMRLIEEGKANKDGIIDVELTQTPTWPPRTTK